MNRLLLFLLLIILVCSCSERKKSYVKTKEVKHIIAILPFDTTDKELINEVKSGLEERLLVEITVLPAEQLPAFAFYKPRSRYIADSLLDFLEQHNNKRFEKIIGITEKDISTRKDPYANWGIMGLANCPGEACVISSFRAKRQVKNRPHFVRRMIVLAMHELGHTYSLPHCVNTSCIMKDAEGKMNLDNGERYCNACRDYLKQEKVLKQELAFQ